MNYKQEIALAVKCQIKVPEFQILSTLSQEEYTKIIIDPSWEINEDIAIKNHDKQVTQIYFWDGENLRFPLLLWDDKYKYTDRQGERYNTNLITAMSKEIWVNKHFKKELGEYLQHKAFIGFVGIILTYVDHSFCFHKFLFSIPKEYIIAYMNLWQISDIKDMKQKENGEGLFCAMRLEIKTDYPERKEFLENEFQNIEGIYFIDDHYIMSHYQQSTMIEEGWKALYQKINKKIYLHNGLCFNRDGGIMAVKMYNNMTRKRLFYESSSSAK